METLATLIWLRDSGVQGLLCRTWLVVGNRIHGNSLCHAIQRSSCSSLESGLEDLASHEICTCVFDVIPSGERENSKLFAARIRIALETLAAVIAEGNSPERKRYPNIHAAVLANIGVEALRSLDGMPEAFQPAKERCITLWDEALTQHPVDWETFDAEILHRAAWQLTSEEIYEDLMRDGLLESQRNQKFFTAWKDLVSSHKTTAGHLAPVGTELATTEEETALVAAWSTILAGNLSDDTPMVCYIGSPAVRLRVDLQSPRVLVIARGIKTSTGKHGFADSGFGIYPRVVARALVQDQHKPDIFSRSSSHVASPGGLLSILGEGTDLLEYQLETALSLWRESFDLPEENPLYRDMLAAINAAREL